MKTKGFTLVELLVVIAILAILATVSVVGYTSFIDSANDSVALSELTQIRDSYIANLYLDSTATPVSFNDEATLTKGYVGCTEYYKYEIEGGVAYWNVATGDVTTDDVTFAATATHTYTDAEDTTCDVCGAVKSGS